LSDSGPATPPRGELDWPALQRLAVRTAITLTILGFFPGLLEPFTPAKALAVRVLGLALLAGTAAQMALGRFARGSGARDHAGRLSLLDGGVLAWTFVSLVSALAGVSLRLSSFGEIEQREGWITTLSLAGLYLAARFGHRDRADTRRTLGVVIGAAVVTAAYALLQRAGYDLFQWENVSRYPAGGISVLRPGATLGSAIALGIVLATALALTVARLAREGGFATLGPAVILLAFALAATLSRGPWLAGLAGVAVALLWFALGKPRGARPHLRATSILLAVTFAVAALVFLPHGGAERLTENGRPGAVSLPARVEIARAAIALWRARPWLGVGPDAFGLEFPSVQTPELWRIEWLGLPVHAHSALLQILATLGLAGILAGGLWLLGLIVAWRARRAAAPDDAPEFLAALAALVVAGLLHPVGLAGAAIFVTMSGVLAARPGDAASGAERASFGSSAIAALVAVGLLVPAARELSALAAAGRARGALLQSIASDPATRGNARLASVSEAARATALAPGEDQLWRLECDACLSAARVRIAARELGAAADLARGAESAARHSLRLEPRRAGNYQRLGNALAMRAALLRAGVASGDSSARWEPVATLADAAYDRAERLAPADALILTDRVSAELALGRNSPALDAARRIISMYPAAASGYALEAAALLGAGRLADARASLLKARDARWEAEDAPRRAAVEALLRDLARADSLRAGETPR